ncbi:MAG: leucine--tRNA ligase [Candidatus Odinarchaeota archaeon]|nr:leucine--tRNA ligase [Candidatus Odinarchaeota archaeon]
MSEEFLKELREIEKKWQAKWEEAKIFEANIDKTKPKFFLTVPYPYTSGPLHIGHGRTYTMGDIYARYMRMKGYNLLWPMAFHITGTPIEGISSRLKEGDKKTRDLYKYYVSLYERDPKKIDEIIESFKEPWNVAKFFSSVIINDFKALGFGIDWRRRFTTGDPEYNQFVTWQFKKLYEKGLIKKGKYPVLYCPNHKSAVGEDDIKSGDVLKPDVAEFYGIKFKFDGKYLVAATLRPETIYGVTNVWVHPDADYVEAKIDNEVWIISKRSAEKLKMQDHKVEIVKEFKGQELIGKYVEAPIGRKVPILPATFVNPNHASGVVYSVPAHAPYDWMGLYDLQRDEEAIKKYKLDPEMVKSIKPISIIKIEGYGEFPAVEVCERMEIKNQNETKKLDDATEEIYKAEFYGGIMKENCGPFAGKKIADIKKDVVDYFTKQGYIDVIYEVTAKETPVYCRCGGEIMVAVMPDQWFLDYSVPWWKENAWKCLNEMAIIPETYRKLFEATFDWLHQRPCARKRGLGTRLPFDKSWIIESLSDSTIYMAFYTVIHKIREHKLKPEQLTYEFWDYVFLNNGDVKEVSKKTGISVDILNELQQEFMYWYPNDHRHTAPPHISNHLTFFIFHHVAIFPEKHWPKKITLNELVIREGRKMSKSEGNVIPLVEVPKAYSSDIYRLYISSAADLGVTVNWVEKEVGTVIRRLQQFWEWSNQVIQKSKEAPLKVDSLSYPSKWLVSKINSVLEEVSEGYQNMSFRTVMVKGFFDMNINISKYEKMAKNVPEEEKYQVYRYILDKLIRILAPIIPHIAEELWTRMGHYDFVSTAKWPAPEKEFINPDVENIIMLIDNTINDIKEIMGLLRGSAKKATIILPENWKYEVVNALKENNIPPNMKEMMSFTMKNPEFRKNAKEVKAMISKIAKAQRLWPFSDRKSEKEAFEILKNYILSETGLESLNVVFAEELQHQKAKQALPGKPSILLE